MAKDIHFTVLACCVVALSFATTPLPEKKEKMNTYVTAHLNTTLIMTQAPSSSQTQPAVTESSSNATRNDTTASTMTISALSEGLPLPTTNTNQDYTGPSQTITEMAESTTNPQPSQSTVIWTSVTNASSLMTTISGSENPNSTAITTHTTQTTVNDTSAPKTTSHPSTGQVSPTVNTTSESLHNTTQGSLGLGLDTSEKNMTVLFSVLLGVFVLGVVMFMFSKYKHRLQYTHEPLYNTEDTARLATDDDTLVISGGLYDGHEVYDIPPSAPTSQSQFRLEFLNEGERSPSF